ncbi:hypothetical protein BDF20DRAFT_837060 [Mycotypha africana]|uniref:uncharacterized protein n=1 Tax=Mycotypha africana TaxID=64632 RepID=UPI0023003027|nr:uncharacterized protein BDF20DRAFT_837060 [Mycotypha africana]KAI8975688.1 hypothetical protein BDF20DRAFT_837060 [Mycotypha africana]
MFKHLMQRMKQPLFEHIDELSYLKREAFPYFSLWLHIYYSIITKSSANLLSENRSNIPIRSSSNASKNERGERVINILKGSLRVTDLALPIFKVKQYKIFAEGNVNGCIRDGLRLFNLPCPYCRTAKMGCRRKVLVLARQMTTVPKQYQEWVTNESVPFFFV